MQARAASPGCWLGTRARPARTLRHVGRKRPCADDYGAVWPLAGPQCGLSPSRAAPSISTSSCRGACSPAFRIAANAGQPNNTFFAAALILSAAGDPVVERAVGRCLADLARLGRSLLWGSIGPRVRWRPKFALARTDGRRKRLDPTPSSMRGSSSRTTRPSSARGSIRSYTPRNRISPFPVRAWVGGKRAISIG